MLGLRCQRVLEGFQNKAESDFKRFWGTFTEESPFEIFHRISLVKTPRKSIRIGDDFVHVRAAVKRG